MTVNLTRIYTRLGDGGETHLGDMSRVPKTHPRIEAYGTVDELNAQIGLTLTVAGLPADYADWLRRIQNDLFDVGADIAAPEDPGKERLRPGDGDPAGEAPTVEVRDEPGGGAQQRRLPRAGDPGQQHELARLDPE